MAKPDEAEALTRANRELEARVDLRTAELAQLNAQLRDSEERLQLAQAHAEAGTWDWDIASDRIAWSDSYYALYGRDRSEIQPSFVSWLEMMIPEDRKRAEAAVRTCLERRRTDFRVEYRIEHPRRGERWIAGRGRLTLDEAGRPARLLGVIFDITERKQVQLALAAANTGLRREVAAREAGEQRLRVLMEGIPQLIWRAQVGGSWSWCSPQWCRTTGLTELSSLEFGWLEAIHPEDREAARQAWRAADGEAALEMETRIYSTAHSAYRWFQTRAAPVRDNEGRMVEWLGASTDIHDLRRLQERQSVMVAELQHRTRNLLGVVRGLAQQTVREVPGLSEFSLLFGERLSLLSRVQGLLSRSDEQPITIGALLRMEVEAVGGPAAGRVTLSGPEVTLRNSTVQTLALAFHELATNARKYGPLGQGAGRLDIHWAVRTGGDVPRHLHVEWHETGENHTLQHNQELRSGYGRELIERALPYSLGAQTRFTLTPEGMSCIIDLPL